MLLQLLARLSWQLLPPAALERLEALALLSGPALLDIYRWAAGGVWYHAVMLCGLVASGLVGWPVVL